MKTVSNFSNSGFDFRLFYILRFRWFVTPQIAGLGLNFRLLNADDKKNGLWEDGFVNAFIKTLHGIGTTIKDPHEKTERKCVEYASFIGAHHYALADYDGDEKEYNYYQKYVAQCDKASVW